MIDVTSSGRPVTRRASSAPIIANGNASMMTKG